MRTTNTRKQRLQTTTTRSLRPPLRSFSLPRHCAHQEFRPRELPIIIAGASGLNAAGGFPDGPGLMAYDALSTANRAEVDRFARRRRHLSPDADPTQGIFIRRENYEHAGEIPPSFQKREISEFLGIHEVPAGSDTGISIESGTIVDGKEPGTQWQILGPGEKAGTLKVAVIKKTTAHEETKREVKVSSSGKIPDGIQLGLPDAKGLDPLDQLSRMQRMGVYTASEALKNSGLSWEKILQNVGAERIATFMGTAYGDLSHDGAFGYLYDWIFDRSAKGNIIKVAMSLADTMGAEIAAHVLGPLAFLVENYCEIAACATFGYNLARAVAALRNGEIDIAIVGTSDSAILPWVVESFSRKTIVHDRALRDWAASVKDPELRQALDNDPDLFLKMASRCFSGVRLGFVMGEGSITLVLMRPGLARKLGVSPLGSIGPVRCSSDGLKGSITEPGVGPYRALGRVMRNVKAAIGWDALQKKGFGLAHETSTPDSSPWESRFWDRQMQYHDLRNFPITAPKGYVGHTSGASGGDQMTMALGAFRYGVVPKIPFLKQLGIGSDVSHERLHLLKEHLVREPQDFQVAIAMQAGFGGHNACFSVYSPAFTMEYLLRDLGRKNRLKFLRRQETTEDNRRKRLDHWFAGTPEIEFSKAVRDREKSKDLDRVDRSITEMNEDGFTLDGKIRVRY